MTYTKQKKLVFLTLCAVLFFSWGASATSAAGENVKIRSIDTELFVKENGEVRVTERILADFASSPGHGIYRDIPHTYKNRDGSVLRTDVRVESVADDNNTPYEFLITRNNANLRIRIGDPDVLISDTRAYVIVYTVTGILLSFDRYDELYWNAVGPDWSSSIDTASARVSLPEDGVIQTACYTGPVGSDAPCASQEMEPGGVIFLAENIKPHEAFTVAVGFEKGMVNIPLVESPPSTVENKLSVTPFDIILFVITIAVGFALIARHWWQHGRDKWWKRKNLHDPDAHRETMPLFAHESIVPEYEPPDGLRPAEVGLIKDETADTLDISATIVDLAVRGYIVIEEVPKKWLFGSTDYRLIQMKKSDERLMAYERTLLDALFAVPPSLSLSSIFRTMPEEPTEAEQKGIDSVLLSALQRKFYKKLKKIKTLLYEEGVTKKYFTQNPETVRNKHRTGSVIGIVIGILLIVLSAVLSTTAMLPAVGLGIVAISLFHLFIGPYIMPQRTARGRELYRKIRGYELFLESTEKYRQPFFENENTFMAVLPYAMVFGVTKKLAEAMKKLGIEPQQPSWFISHSGDFSIDGFSTSLNSLSTSLGSAMASSPSGSGSGGGGSSGGGGGGGGGGGW